MGPNSCHDDNTWHQLHNIQRMDERRRAPELELFEVDARDPARWIRRWVVAAFTVAVDPVFCLVTCPIPQQTGSQRGSLMFLIFH